MPINKISSTCFSTMLRTSQSSNRGFGLFASLTNMFLISRFIAGAVSSDNAF